MKNKFIAGVVAFFALPSVALAQSGRNAGESMKGMFDQMGPAADLLMGGAFIFGIVIAIAAIAKFKAYADDSQRNKIGPALIMLAIAGLCIGLPAAIKISQNSTVGGAANSLTRGSYTSIGG